MKLTFRSIAVTGAGVAALVTNPAFAYLDPGTGSALIQGLIASIAALGLTLKVYWHRVIGFFGLRRKSETVETDEETTHTPPSRD